jgi:hypothetical protein
MGPLVVCILLWIVLYILFGNLIAIKWLRRGKTKKKDKTLANYFLIVFFWAFGVLLFIKDDWLL